MVAMQILLLCFLQLHLGLCICPSTVHKDIRGFGPDCKYRCNCRNNEQCDNNTGECPNGCLQGWMGPACQYRNIAASSANTKLNPSQSAATFYSTKTVDLDETTCGKTGSGPGRRWLRISLDNEFYLVGFVLKLPNYQSGLVQGFSVEIGNSTDNWRLCFKQVEVSHLDALIELHCFEPVVGQHIRISLSENNTEELSICELEIYGGRLVSFNRHTRMSSTFDKTGGWNSSYGVDGKVSEVNVKQDYETMRTCSATNSEGTAHWWNVDLSALFSIQGLSFFGRQDTATAGQYRGFSITYQQNNDRFVEIFRDTSTMNNYKDYKPRSTNFTWPVNSQVVRVNRSSDILVLCELEVFADCSYGLCGWECEKTCMCSSQTTGTHKIVGTCPHGCAGRWTGEGRMCNTECNDSQWGTDCTKKCGNCEGPCDVKTGVCSTLCKPGWMLPDCTQVCSSDRFGQNCSGQCGNCRNVCDPITGQCPAGCKPGFMLEFCNKTCDRGMYGDNCSHPCGYCRNNASCEHVDGRCSDGCDARYTGPLCKPTEETLADIPKGSAGGTIGVIVAAFVVIAVVVVAVVILRRRLLRCMSQCSTKEDSLSLAGNSHDENGGTSVSQEHRQGEFECYYNANGADTSISKIIEVSDLREECRKAKRNLATLSDDFDRIPYGLLKDASEALKTEYLQMNRYKEICPYNENRVHLPEITGVPASTYINASYITGYHRPKRYIAAQGALKTTVDDIWRMIWSENIVVIVMLTDCVEAGKQKCVPYWPDEGSSIYGDIKTELVSVESYTNFKIRTFKIGKGNSKPKRTVVQFHFTAWPDKDVPDTVLSIVQFWRKVREYVPADKTTVESPWLVHCSAGVGRTGSFIAMDYLYDQGQEEGKVDVKACVSSLRNQRVKMVQTKEQYYLLHEIVAEILDPIGTACSSEEYLRIYPTLVSDTAAKKQRLYQEYKKLCKASEETDEAQEEEGGIYSNNLGTRKRDADKLENIPKSRDPNICPEDRDRPYLPLHIGGCGDFINAVYISTYRYKDRMILTQFPLKNTVVDFLIMLWQLNITEVVLLENLPPEEGKYWPQQGRLLKAGPFTVKIVQEESLEIYVLKTLRLTMDGNKEHKDVRQYHFQQWQQEANIPYDAASILQLISDLEKDRSSGKSAPLVIQCLDGAKRSGLLCLVYSVLESVKLDSQVAVAETLRLARVKRMQIISDFDQYKFCHEVINEYLQRFDVYANVT